MTPLRLDRDKAAAIAAAALEQRPKLARLLDGSDDGSGQRWRIRCDLDGEQVTISVRAPSGVHLALWQGPRHYVERDEPAVMQ
jgi:hypothetical protein